MIFYTPLSAAIVTFLLTHFLLSSEVARKIQDMPNERSLHNTPVPRIGGVGLMAGILSGWALIFNSLAWWLVVPLLVLFAVSLLDDVHNLPVKQRFLAHLVAAAIMVGGSGLFSQQGVVIAVVVVLLTVWMTNLYNFMDGSDGLAGGMALFGFGTYGIAALFAQNIPMAALSFCITASAASFLYFNFHPAKIFMGDSGSIPLGFLAAAMGVWGVQQGSWASWFPLMVFSPFIVDASITLVKRTLRGVKVTEAHREHYYQRLVQTGWGHSNVALAEYGLMLAVSASALWGLKYPFQWQMLLVWCGIYACLMLFLDTRWNNYTRGK
jgi:UDP-N-acetylmuramyl pentapeptide phosphotransferase/UDP-N-acetylglucosamine-1-phosphate transferase